MRKLPAALTPESLQQFGAATEINILTGSNQWLDVSVVTPILGGGVDSFEPDTVDIIRVPSIRGAVRWWWRAMQVDHQKIQHVEGKGCESVEENKAKLRENIAKLREKERQVWGGVGSKPGECYPSAVRVLVQVTNKGRAFAAGAHRRQDHGGLKALPDWVGGAEYGYALFPLQQPQEARADWKGTGDLATKSWRTGVEFKLYVTFRPSKELKLTPKDCEDREKEVRNAFKLWLCFGGYGARTRRGFGALDASTTDLNGAKSRLDLAAAENLLQGYRAGNASCGRPSLFQHDLLWDREKSQAPDAAHKLILSAYREFRQGVGFGRQRGLNKLYGRSNWPEADSFRKLTGLHFVAHGITNPLMELNAPRAEFGLPILVQFKDLEDKRADGELVGLRHCKDKNSSSTELQRWASPLIFRPIRSGSGWVAVVLVLKHRPSKVSMKLKSPPKATKPPEKGKAKDEGVEVAYQNGALGEVHKALTGAGNSALQAFVKWLRTKDFQ